MNISTDSRKKVAFAAGNPPIRGHTDSPPIKPDFSRERFLLGVVRVFAGIRSRFIFFFKLYQSEIPEKHGMNSQKQKSEGIGDCIELFHFERISYSVNRKSEDGVRLEHLYLHDKWLRENKFLLPDGRLPFRQPPVIFSFLFLSYVPYK